MYYVNIILYVYTYTHHCSPLHIRNVPYSTSIHSLVQSPCFFVESVSSTEHLTQRQPQHLPLTFRRSEFHAFFMAQEAEFPGCFNAPACGRLPTLRCPQHLETWQRNPPKMEISTVFTCLQLRESSN